MAKKSSRKSREPSASDTLAAWWKSLSGSEKPDPNCQPKNRALANPLGFLQELRETIEQNRVQLVLDYYDETVLRTSIIPMLMRFRRWFSEVFTRFVGTDVPEVARRCGYATRVFTQKGCKLRREFLQGIRVQLQTYRRLVDYPYLSSPLVLTGCPASRADVMVAGVHHGLWDVDPKTRLSMPWLNKDNYEVLGCMTPVSPSLHAKAAPMLTECWLNRLGDGPEGWWAFLKSCHTSKLNIAWTLSHLVRSCNPVGGMNANELAQFWYRSQTVRVEYQKWLTSFDSDHVSMLVNPFPIVHSKPLHQSFVNDDGSLWVDQCHSLACFARFLIERLVADHGKKQESTRAKQSRPKLEWEAEAKIIVAENPSIHVEELAARVGKARTTIERRTSFMNFWSRCKEADARVAPPQGMKDADGNLEAIDPDSQ